MAIICHMRRSAVFAGRFDSRNRLESGKIRVNMLTRQFAFVPPCRGSRPFQFRESEQLFFWKATNSCRIGTYRWIDYGKTLKYNECLEDVRMEFKEKLQLLRTNMKLSQEELVNRLYLWSGKP